ncbi:MAG: pyridoxal-phosphate dependent enzyme, partial [Alphaproteobacteria bacterium]|nr:pyridoxal-phosphate dependent enzyme [Alphaproteobacteria bacterium]
METVTLSDLEAAADIVAAHMTSTPMIRWPLLAARAGADVWVKHENHTPIGAFNVRGGCNYMTRLKQDLPDCPCFITATRGNQAQSIGLPSAKGGPSGAALPHVANDPAKQPEIRAYAASF